MTHFYDVIVLNSTVQLALHARLLTAVHFVIKGGGSLSVAWPDWEEREGGFGMRFRVIGSAVDILNFKACIVMLEQNDLIRLGTMKAIPEDVSWCIFIRDRSHEKRMSPSQKRRLEQRALARGEAHKERTVQPSKAKNVHFLMMQSASNGQEFPLFVLRKTLTQNEAETHGGSEYGLGKVIPLF